VPVPVSTAKQATSGKKLFMNADSKLAENLSKPKLYLRLTLKKFIPDKSHTFAALLAARPFSVIGHKYNKRLGLPSFYKIRSSCY
jgi:hypothetical protein